MLNTRNSLYAKKVILCKLFEIFNTHYEKYKYLNKYTTIHNKIRLDVT